MQRRNLRRRLAVCSAMVPLALSGTAAAAAPHQTARQWDHQRVDHVRAVHHERPVSIGPRLNARAQAWADYVAAHPHIKEIDDPGGARVCFGAGGHHSGGNAATGFASVREAQKGLEGSPPHFANMTDPRFQWMGIGIATTKGGEVVLIQDFCGR